ncbi:MAG: hypothetical protein JO065_02205 [Acidobacteria bacterium]|nr:hypothetical protein [Acidobacteriota bacterium]
MNSLSWIDGIRLWTIIFLVLLGFGLMMKPENQGGVLIGSAIAALGLSCTAQVWMGLVAGLRQR